MIHASGCVGNCRINDEVLPIVAALRSTGIKAMVPLAERARVAAENGDARGQANLAIAFALL